MGGGQREADRAVARESVVAIISLLMRVCVCVRVRLCESKMLRYGVETTG